MMIGTRMVREDKTARLPHRHGPIKGSSAFEEQFMGYDRGARLRSRLPVHPPPRCFKITNVGVVADTVKVPVPLHRCREDTVISRWPETTGRRLLQSVDLNGAATRSTTPATPAGT